MNSAIYEGVVRHVRLQAPARTFSYGLFMAWLDLDELPAALDGGWPIWSARRPALVRWKRQDYLGPIDLPLDEAVRRRVDASIGRRPEGPIRMLTHLRWLGWVLNPVTFYYCYRPDGETLDAIVAEITNTPWNERHAYVLDACDGLQFRFRKEFHVSPFLGMDHDNEWHFTRPGRGLAVRMHNLREGATLFRTTLAVRRREMTRSVLARTLAAHPFMAFQVAAGIYAQALRLVLRRAPFHPHPTRHPEAAHAAAEAHARSAA